MTSARAVTLSWLVKPASSLHSPIFLLQLFLLLVHLIHVSDCASVRISGEDDVILESLAASKILMDRANNANPFKPSTSATPLKPISSTEISQLALKSTTSTTGVTTSGKIIKSNLSGNKESKNNSPGISSSPLHVAQCRATCLQKFTETDVNPSGSATVATATVMRIEKRKGSDAPSTISLNEQTTIVTTSSKVEEDETIHLMPKILRLKRRKRTLSLLPLKKSTWSCIQDSQECLSCWKSCQLLDSALGENNAINLSEQKSTGKTNEATASTNFPFSDDGRDPLVVADDQVNKQTKAGKTTKNKQSIYSTSLCASLVDSKQCMAGCQVACSFYERLFTSEKGENEKKPESGAFAKGADPVVATKHESILEIVPGKLTWPAREKGKKTGDSLKMMIPVVYVVIQEYPDRKWRQIAQTTEEEFSIPKELTSAMKTKLRSIRVLVVGPEGLLSVYSSSSSNDPNGSPEKIQGPKKFLYKSNNSGKVVVVEEKKEEATTAITLEETNDKENGSESDGDGYVTQEQAGEAAFGKIEATAAAEKSRKQLQTDYIRDAHKNKENGGGDGSKISSKMMMMIMPPVRDSAQSIETVTVEPFELSVVSLIHQRSLVIAELKWNQIGGNSNQEYLITWELTGGGLKGHLVTDSTSVTLSLWPDTTYQIQVEKFDQNLDSDGEQPVESSPNSLKSLPLIVDTTEASFPMGSSSALLRKNGEEDDDDYDNEQHLDEDEFSEEQNGNESIEEEKPTHKSFMNLPNISLLLSIAVISAMLVLLILTLTAYAWTKLQTQRIAASSQKLATTNTPAHSCFSFSCHSINNSCNISNFFTNCFSSEKEPQLLLSHADSQSDITSPFYYTLEVKRSQSRSKKSKKMPLHHHHQQQQSSQDKVAGQSEADCELEEPVLMPVAVISSSSSLSSGITSDSAAAFTPSSSLFHYYPSKNGLQPSSSSREELEASVLRGKALSSSSWIPTTHSARATNNPTTAATLPSSKVTTTS